LVFCCHCDGTLLNSTVGLNTHLKAPEGPYSIVLPICKECIYIGCHIVVHSARQNAVAKEARLDADHERKVLRQEMAVAKEASSNDVTASVNVPRS
jgi:hypothetical protein